MGSLHIASRTTVHHQFCHSHCRDHSGVALDVWSYSALIKGYVQNSDLKLALELLQEMKHAHRVLPNEVCCCLSLLQFALTMAVMTQQERLAL